MITFLERCLYYFLNTVKWSTRLLMSTAGLSNTKAFKFKFLNTFLSDYVKRNVNGLLVMRTRFHIPELDCFVF